MPTTDLSKPGPWRESRRRALARRAEAVRARRRGRAGRSALAALGVSLSLAAGGALAQSGGATPTTAAPAAAKPTVAQVQGALGVPADGVLGPQSRRALKRFQRAHGLKVTGRVNAATLAALGLAAAPVGRTLDAVPAGAAATLAAIARCESGGDPAAISSGGTYRGKYQFSLATWVAMGGTGDPAAADEATQDAMAAKLYAARGTAPWPACAAGL